MPRKTEMVDLKLFRNPTAEYRPSPFWSVNADLSGGEQRWQIRQMKKAGMGGFFYHPRAGLVTEYLSEKWFSLVGACVAEAKRLKMEAWLYDEDKWPSGFAGGLLLDRHPEFRIKELLFGRGGTVSAARTGAEGMALPVGVAQTDIAGERFEPLADFGVRRSGGKWAYRRIRAGGAPRRGEDILSFILHHGSDSNWTGGHSYVDLMDAGCVKEFIRMTHGEYVKRFGKHLGRTIPGIFTDEPNNHNWQSALTWSRGFETDLARAVRGGIDRLPALVLPTADAPEVRFAYMKAVSERFHSSFTKQIGDFCAKTGFAMTGHFLDEDGLHGNCKYSGGVMPGYEWMQVPGIDHLLRQAGQRLTHKQVSSVARQFGRTRVMSEIFGVSGHSMSFEDYKWIGDWHIVNGINFFVPHLVLQSMAGMRKRDYPPNISWHQPWWPDSRDLFDYFSRVTSVMRRGRAVAEVLVLHPIDSAWLAQEWDERGPAGPGGRRREVGMDELDKGLNAVMDALADAHRDFDLGDGTVMARHARVAGKAFRVAKCGEYHAVVVPPSKNWRESTVKLLEKWAAVGGAIVFAGTVPEMVDGKPAVARWKRLFGGKSVERSDLGAQSIEAALARLVVPRDLDILVSGKKFDDEVVYEHRREGHEHILFLVNRSRTRVKSVEVNLPFHAGVERLDPFTGGMVPHSATRTEKTGFALELPPVGSALFRLDERKTPSFRGRPSQGKRMAVRLGQPQAVTPDRPNILVLDRCRFSVNGSGDGKLHPVFEARKAAFDSAGLKEFEGLQPWRMRYRGISPTKTARVEMAFPFRIEAGQVPALDLVLETPGCYEVTLNGKNIPSNPSERWLQDPGLRRVRLGNAVRKGDNELVLAGVYGLAMEIEDLFLLGKFTVKGPVEGPFVMDDYTAPGGLGDWTRAGYRFFTGAMNYRFRVAVPEAGNWLLRLGKASGSVFRVRVDGRSRGRIWCAPWEADLGKLSRGSHVVEIEAVSTLQNAFGPLHSKWYETKGYYWWIGPEAFVNDQIERYHIHPYGLLESPMLLKAG